MINPYGRQIYTVNLKRGPDDEGREGADGFVFWTKNIGPLMRHLPEIRASGYPFVVQHTITGYPRQLEARVIDYNRAVANMRALRDAYGPKVAVWRYDPILITSLTPPEWHREMFCDLAEGLRGATDEVIISFAQIYKKAERNLDLAAKRSRSGLTWREHESFAYDERQDEAKGLVCDLARIAQANDMRLSVCSQPRFHVEGVGPAHCIEDIRLREVAEAFGIKDKPITARVKGNRPQCECSASRDIGDYDTCPHGCVYCYAVMNPELALDRYRRHNPDSPFLFEPEPRAIQVERPSRASKRKQPATSTASLDTPPAKAWGILGSPPQPLPGLPEGAVRASECSGRRCGPGAD
jgi:hypothetical protein